MILDKVEPAKAEDYVALLHLFPASIGVRHSHNTNKPAQLWNDGACYEETEACYNNSTDDDDETIVL